MLYWLYYTVVISACKQRRVIGPASPEDTAQRVWKPLCPRTPNTVARVAFSLIFVVVFFFFFFSRKSHFFLRHNVVGIVLYTVTLSRFFAYIRIPVPFTPVGVPFAHNGLLRAGGSRWLPVNSNRKYYWENALYATPRVGSPMSSPRPTPITTLLPIIIIRLSVLERLQTRRRRAGPLTPSQWWRSDFGFFFLYSLYFLTARPFRTTHVRRITVRILIYPYTTVLPFHRYCVLPRGVFH